MHESRFEASLTGRGTESGPCLIVARLSPHVQAKRRSAPAMVVWCHIQGYMIYILCVLGAMRLLVDELCGVHAVKRRRGGAVPLGPV